MQLIITGQGLSVDMRREWFNQSEFFFPSVIVYNLKT